MLTAILVVVMLSYVRVLWNRWDDSKASFLQAEAVEAEGDSGGEESDEVEAAV